MSRGVDLGVNSAEIVEMIRKGRERYGWDGLREAAVVHRAFKAGETTGLAAEVIRRAPRPAHAPMRSFPRRRE